jgi:hypothetical protein
MLPLASLLPLAFFPLQEEGTRPCLEVRAAPTPALLRQTSKGEWIREESARGAQSCWSNAELSGLYVPVPVGEEWVDWGIKGCSTTGLLQSLTLGYATTSLDLLSGGPGARLELVLRQGTLADGVPGTEVERFILEALPGAESPDVPFAALLTLELEVPICLDDGPIGWSYAGLDGATGPLLVTTEAPLDPATGTVDAFDVYAMPASDASYLGAGSLPLDGIGSFYLELAEYDGQPQSVVAYNADSTNPIALSQHNSPVLAGEWELRVDLSFRPGANLSTLLVGTRPLDFPTAWGRLLVAPPFLKPFDLGQGLHLLPIPKDPSLDGLRVYVQGVLVAPGGKLVLTNAFYVTLGL